MSNENENVQVDETVEAVTSESRPNPDLPTDPGEKGGQDVPTPDLHGHDDPAGGSSGISEDVSGSPEKSDEDQDGGSQGHDDPDSNPGQDDPGSDQPDTFPREYVEKLRKENASYREKAKHADDLAHRLHTALVAADGRLADPTDLPFDPAHLDDPDALAAAVTALVRTRPGLKAQQIRGDVGAGDRGTPKKAPVDLISLMRGM